jgi:hypothetical protein
MVRDLDIGWLLMPNVGVNRSNDLGSYCPDARTHKQIIDLPIIDLPG